MTIAELIAALAAHAPETDVYLSIDPEGNGYRPIVSVAPSFQNDARNPSCNMRG